MGLAIFLIFVVSAIYVQTRGEVVHARLTRRLVSHANLMAPINCLFYLFSKVSTRQPFIDPSEFKELAVFQENWETIRDEALSLHQAREIKASDDLDDLGFNSFFRTGWKRFYLKWYGASLHSAEQLCPKTTELLNQIPSVKGGMFTMLPPGANLVRHSDPYAGSLRYHLGLKTPNSDDCFIMVDGQKYSWRDGEAVMFDETYIHWAENHTDTDRIILFLDIKRPVWFFLVDWFNIAFSRTVMAATATKNVEGDKVGFLNRAFQYLYEIRKVGKRIKKFSPFLYYFLQYALYAYLVYLLIF